MNLDKINKSLKDNIQCNPQLHTAYRSVLGQLNWLQSRTQVHICYKFSRCASAAASPTIGDVREINKVVRTLKSQYVDGRFRPLKGSQRILGMPDASYRNNSDKSSQRAHVIFLAEDRKLPSKGTYRNSGYDKQAHRIDGSNSATRGSIIDYESHKITTTTQPSRKRPINVPEPPAPPSSMTGTQWLDQGASSSSSGYRGYGNIYETTSLLPNEPTNIRGLNMCQDTPFLSRDGFESMMVLGWT